MKLDDGKPWFRRWMVIGFKPITSEGKMVINLMSGVCIATGFLLLYFADQWPGWLAIPIAISFATVLAGYVIIYWKREDPF